MPNRDDRRIADANFRSAGKVFDGFEQSMGEIVGRRQQTIDHIKSGLRNSDALIQKMSPTGDAVLAAPVIVAGAQPDRAAPDEADWLPPALGETPGFWRSMSDLWAFAGRREQQPPAGDWRSWLILGGRGSGKTRAGAEWVHAIASAGQTSDLRIALVAESLGDAREVMIDGMSGISRIARRRRPDFEISRRRLVWPNGAVAQIFSSEDPESLRGPQFHFAWCDEQSSALCAQGSILL